MHAALVALFLAVAPDPLAPAVSVVEVPTEVDGLTLIAVPGPGEGVAKDLAAALPRERRDLAGLLGRDELDGVQIRVGYGPEEFRALQPRDRPAPGWAAGVAYPDLSLVVLDAHASGRAGDPRAVLRHELAHVALGRLDEERLPRWFSEGFALVHAGEWSLSRAAILARAVASDSLIPVDSLRRSWPRAPSDVDLAYAQSASLVAYLAGVEGGASLRGLVARMAAGEAFDAAFRGAYGQPVAAVEIDWKQSLSRRYGWLPTFLDSSLLWVAAAALAAFGGLRARARARRRLEELAAREELEPPPDLEAQHRAIEAALAAEAAAREEAARSAAVLASPPVAAGPAAPSAEPVSDPPAGAPPRRA